MLSGYLSPFQCSSWLTDSHSTMGSQLCVMHWTPADVLQPLAVLELQPFRDAGYAPATYPLHILSIVYGLHRALSRGLFAFDDFDLARYERFERVEEGDFNAICRGIVAFASPIEDGWADTAGGQDRDVALATSDEEEEGEQDASDLAMDDDDDGARAGAAGTRTTTNAKGKRPLGVAAARKKRRRRRARSPAPLASLSRSFRNVLDEWRRLGVSAVVRLNRKLYDRRHFERAGIEHVESESCAATGLSTHPLAEKQVHHGLTVYFDDGTNPSLEMTREFIQIADRVISAGGTIAVHCKAGLGRTGTLIGAYLIYKHGFTACEAIGFMRLMRPGTCVGPQQHFMYENQHEWVRWAAVDEARKLGAINNSVHAPVAAGLAPPPVVIETVPAGSPSASPDEGQGVPSLSRKKRKSSSGEPVAALPPPPSASSRRLMTPPITEDELAAAAAADFDDFVAGADDGSAAPTTPRSGVRRRTPPSADRATAAASTTSAAAAVPGQPRKTPGRSRHGFAPPEERRAVQSSPRRPSRRVSGAGDSAGEGGVRMVDGDTADAEDGGLSADEDEDDMDGRAGNKDTDGDELMLTSRSLESAARRDVLPPPSSPVRRKDASASSSPKRKATTTTTTTTAAAAKAKAAEEAASRGRSLLGVISDSENRASSDVEIADATDADAAAAGSASERPMRLVVGRDSASSKPADENAGADSSSTAPGDAANDGSAPTATTTTATTATAATATRYDLRRVSAGGGGVSPVKPSTGDTPPSRNMRKRVAPPASPKSTFTSTATSTTSTSAAKRGAYTGSNSTATAVPSPSKLPLRKKRVAPPPPPPPPAASLAPSSAPATGAPATSRALQEAVSSSAGAPARPKTALGSAVRPMRARRN